MIQKSKPFIFIFGPQAVGKMTVGHLLAQRLRYRFFYNHLTIDIAEHFYDRESIDFVKFLFSLNKLIFIKLLEDNATEGLIYTDTWMLDRKYDNTIKNKMFELFTYYGWNVFLVELEASLSKRLERNTTEFRLAHKPSKTNIVFSERHIRNAEINQILNTTKILNWEKPSSIKRHIYINNENISVEKTVEIIIEQLF